MKDTDINEMHPDGQSEETAPSKKKRSHAVKFLLWIFGIITGVIVLFVAALCGLTWWLTPTRLAALISKEVSEEINGELHLSEVRYTLWSSFPHLNVEIDTISLRSRNFDSLPDSLKAIVPAGGDRLASARRFKGSINLMPLLTNRIFVKDIEVDSLDVNLVVLTDSINNYVLTSTDGKSKIPYFHIDGFKMGESGSIAYTSIPAATRALVKLGDVSLNPVRHARHKDNYTLALGGKVDVSSGDLTILHDFPFDLSGDVGVRFDPFGIATTDYRVSLGNIKGEMTMNMNIGDTPSMDQFAYSLHNFTLSDLRAFLPPGNYPVLEHLDADLALDASARLTSPYEFTSAWLPSIEVDFRVPEGRVSYMLSDGTKYEMRRVGLDGRLLFNGRDPEASYIEIPEMIMSGEGIGLQLSGTVTDLMGDPDVSARLDATANLTTVSKAVPDLQPFNLTGDLDIDAGVRFKLDGPTLYGALADLKLQSDRIGMKCGTSDVTLTDFTAETEEGYAAALTQRAVLNRIPVSLRFGASNLAVSDAVAGIDLKAKGVSADAALSPRKEGKISRLIQMSARTKGVSLQAGAMKVGLSDLNVDFKGGKMSTPVMVAPFEMPAKWVSDARTRSYAAHTPEFVQISLPDKVKQLMALWQAKLDVKASGGLVGTRGYPGSTRIGPLSLSASADSVILKNITLSSGRTKGTISARVDNLRQFLNSPVPAPLKVTLNADIDTIQINQLAREYTMRNPRSAIARGDQEAMAAGENNVALLIPRNIIADITATALQTRYINLHLYDLYTKVRLADGKADIDTLRIGSDFGHAGMNMKFDTGDLQNINMAAHLDINDVNVVNFFKNFPKLIEMWPQMKNFEGNLSAGADLSMLVFPSMYLNVPSVQADARVRAWGMTVHQSPFIQRVTRMLLLPGDEDLHIRDITLHAGVHNNLLEIFPFEFEMSKYRMVLGGINNFNGGLYYHVGVVDWPLKMPFGINIKGDFHNPKLRFGGKDWHDKNGARVATGVDDNTRINIMKMGRQYMGEFVHTAATYRGE